MPRVTAVSAGPKTADAACAVACDAATDKNEVSQGKSSEAAVTRTAAATMTVRFAFVLSISAPAGVWARMPATVVTDITSPMLASSHFCIVSK